MARRRVVDVLLVLAVFAFTVGMLSGGREWNDHAARGLDALGVALAAATALPLLLRRRDPVAAFALSGLASAVISALDYPPGPPLGPTVALFFVGRYPSDNAQGRRLAAVTVGGVYLLHVAASWFGHGGSPLAPLLLGALVWGGAWVAGDRVRQRQERTRESRTRVERERRLAAAEERTRIARDLHDSAGHALNVILVQSGAARLLAEKDPAQARAALETLESVARETVDEIDRMVRVLREDGDGAVDPPIGLAALDRLVQRHSETRPSRREGRARRAAAADARRRPGCVPDRPGGADERSAARLRKRRARGDVRRSRTRARRLRTPPSSARSSRAMGSWACASAPRFSAAASRSTSRVGRFEMRAELPYDGGAS